MTSQTTIQTSLSQIPPQAIEQVDSTADILMLLMMLSGPNHGVMVADAQGGNPSMVVK